MIADIRYNKVEVEWGAGLACLWKALLRLQNRLKQAVGTLKELLVSWGNERRPCKSISKNK
jgi:hypothetical protein